MITTGMNRKEAAEAMANVIMSSGINSPGVLKQLQEFNNSSSAETAEKNGESDYIGIWKKDDGEQQYIRDKKKMADWVKWAGQNKIPIITSRKRILLTGESVARGSFYGNEHTPAQVLEHILVRHAGEATVEVVDIAKSGMEMDEMIGLLHSAAVLNPDQVVIMAGNNFFYKLYKDFLDSDAAYGHIAELNEEWLKKRIDASLEALVVSFLEELKRLFVTRNIPVLFVIPAFNLADWKVTALEKQPPFLPVKELEQWEQLETVAREALSHCHYKTAGEAAAGMLALCPAHPVPHELLGEVALAAGDEAAARRHLEKARDHTLLFKSIGKPRILSVVRNALLAHVPQTGMQVVDLAGVFEQWLNRAVPGRDIFMDYCHMNSNGIRLSMAAVAGALAAGLKLPAAELGKLAAFAAETEPSAASSCMAHIYAAIHNAHYGQGYGIVKYHFEQAFAYAPELAARFCRLYIEMATSRLSSPLTRAFNAMLDDVDIRIDQYPEAVFHPANGKLLDLVLTDVMNDILVERGIIPPLSTAALRLEEHAVEHGVVNLLESFYSRNTYDSNYGDGAQFYKSRDRYSEFTFFTHAKSSLVCELVYRVKDKFSGPVKMSINGQPLSELPSSDKWQPGFVKIEQQLLVEGQNTLRITWPIGDQALQPENRITSVNDVIGLLNPVRGELHSFSIWA